MPYRNAARVLPDPVGAWISVCSPDAIAGHPCSWAGVGPAKACVNHSRVRSLKSSSADIPGEYRPKLGRTSVLFASLCGDRVAHRRRRLGGEMLELTGVVPDQDERADAALEGQRHERIDRREVGRDVEQPPD